MHNKLNIKKGICWIINALDNVQKNISHKINRIDAKCVIRLVVIAQILLSLIVYHATRHIIAIIQSYT